MNIRILFFAPAAIIFSGSAHAVCPYDTNCLNNPYGAEFVAKAAHSVDTQDDIKFAQVSRPYARVRSLGCRKKGRRRRERGGESAKKSRRGRPEVRRADRANKQILPQTNSIESPALMRWRARRPSLTREVPADTTASTAGNLWVVLGWVEMAPASMMPQGLPLGAKPQQPSWGPSWASTCPGRRSYRPGSHPARSLIDHPGWPSSNGPSQPVSPLASDGQVPSLSHRQRDSRDPLAEHD